MRTKRKSSRRLNKNKKIIIFCKYSKTKEYLTKTEITKLMKNEFKLNYNNHIIDGLMNIWGKKVSHKLVIDKSTFQKLFKKPFGFFRDKYL
jgi:hypothetical protein|tara:strand:- start:1495 stop:1767 length:273 start_codon:yes stop_codon:yes gene_type:complete